MLMLYFKTLVVLFRWIQERLGADLMLWVVLRHNYSVIDVITWKYF